eukprot:TRINITY_DN30785_c0_g1_i1.p1 TRINITY_DN30785_c0_g1~~TRINITY_DN30785_c0_g1_i1.p1  ORF type:complete len:229 (+),score=-19.31 TRINITY_DN30785_c0_g1_i1:445-1131(+)
MRAHTQKMQILSLVVRLLRAQISYYEQNGNIFARVSIAQQYWQNKLFQGNIMKKLLQQSILSTQNDIIFETINNQKINITLPPHIYLYILIQPNSTFYLQTLIVFNYKRLQNKVMVANTKLQFTFFKENNDLCQQYYKTSCQFRLYFLLIRSGKPVRNRLYKKTIFSQIYFWENRQEVASYQLMEILLKELYKTYIKKAYIRNSYCSHFINQFYRQTILILQKIKIKN